MYLCVWNVPFVFMLGCGGPAHPRDSSRGGPCCCCGGGGPACLRATQQEVHPSREGIVPPLRGRRFDRYRHGRSSHRAKPGDCCSGFGSGCGRRPPRRDNPPPAARGAPPPPRGRPTLWPSARRRCHADRPQSLSNSSSGTIWLRDSPCQHGSFVSRSIRPS